MGRKIEKKAMVPVLSATHECTITLEYSKTFNLIQECFICSTAETFGVGPKISTSWQQEMTIC